ncbi:helix-turn-helix domain-containing protein [Engelhardtia mirabilis]|uniref:helix-turn-helix domain-containing protein n=1 Tax=Engelhardtia mirabilis TaxID=2528011 RepID=UPI0011A24531
MTTSNLFGDLVRSLRHKHGKSLRSFCRENNLDPARISRIERGLAPPPSSKSTLTHLAGALHLERGTEDWESFFDAASIQAHRLPEGLEEHVVAKLPLFFRTLRNAAIDEHQLDEIVDVVRRHCESDSAED